MLEFVRGGYRKLVSFSLWLILIGCTIAGLILGWNADGIGVGILGMVAGFLIGGIIVISFGGFIATILNIDENLQNINDNLQKVVRNMEKKI